MKHGKRWTPVEGKIFEVEPEKRLVMTGQAHWDEAVSKDPPSRVTYELLPARAILRSSESWIEVGP